MRKTMTRALKIDGREHRRGGSGQAHDVESPKLRVDATKTAGIIAKYLAISFEMLERGQ
jgi:hypothetical protein